MIDYPDNSFNSKDRGDRMERRHSNNERERHLEKVIQGETKKRKKSEVRKFASLFTPEDTVGVKEYILFDIVIPGIKNAMMDVLSIMLFGEAGRSRRSDGSGRSKLTYHRGSIDERRERDYARPRSSSFEYDDILFETRGDAEVVLDQLDAEIEQYGMASVGDLYDLAGVTCRSYTANKYGWTDIRNAKVVRVSDGYILQLPRTTQIT